VEDEKAVYVPFCVGSLRRKARERLIAIHAGNGTRVESVEQALHEKIDVFRQSINDAIVPTPERPDVATLTASDVQTAATSPPAAPVCKCGAAMVLRRRKADGEAFWGCSTFPRCRHTMPLD
jgi:hypothetical protein